MLALVTVLLHGHSQMETHVCQGVNGTIEVHNPAISTTYWLKDTTCTFDLHGYNRPIDQVGVTRSSRPAVAGTITYPGALTYIENITVDGTGEPFAILPMYSTHKRDNVTANVIVVTVQGKAMVSFGMAEDPALVFGEVVTDAFRAREWVYGAPYELLYVHVIMLALLLAVLAGGTCNLKGWFCNVPVVKFFFESYKAMRKVSPKLANVAVALGVWSDVSVILDNFLWAGWVWHDIGNYGGGMFIAVIIVRFLFYLYLAYVVWEHPNAKLWTICGEQRLVPLVIGGSLTVYVWAGLYMGREAFSSGAAGYYVGIPVAVALTVCIMPICIKRAYVFGTYMGHLLLVTLLGIVLNVGLGMLAPACMLTAFYKRYRAQMARGPDTRALAPIAAADRQDKMEKWTWVIYCMQRLRACRGYCQRGSVSSDYTAVRTHDLTKQERKKSSLTPPITELKF
jgi:hypothetical protein